MQGEIRVPELGESVLEATVAKWLKQPGDTVSVGEPLVELETEKVNQEVYAEQSGVLASIGKQAGDTVGIGEVIGTLDAATDGAAPALAPEAAGSGHAQAGNGAHTDESVTPDASLPAAAAPSAATPVARRLATGGGIDLAGVQGSGPGGRITKQDVSALRDRGPIAAPEASPAPPAAAPAPLTADRARPTSTGAATGARPEQRVRLTRRRQTIARRLVEAQHTAAMLTTFNEVDMSAIMDVRKRRRDAFKERYNVGLGFMSFFTKASIGALKAFPRLNAEIQGDEIVLKGYYDIGIAVGTDEGLVVPVVRDADRKSFAEIEREIGDLAVRARGNGLTLAELEGGTFTITNGGIYGSLLSTPILNTPQVGILGMHKIEERPVVVNGQVVARPMMYLALSYDHRIVDGSEAVRFLVRIKELLEDPEALLLEG
ncbi:MAG TPA: 2-oxoglutarate dehydrogenase complex dihydrolipoyllysine-residue succinyltransferase [Chloroflexota bacterium]|nr:2-oxoglutarate dehydrogenase complex dihydrolipoyllysine-residue succinyltransferase [Chloroflexota bacterium]